MPQVPDFEIRVATDWKSISITPRNAERLAQALWKRSPGGRVAARIERAMQLGESITTVEPLIGEDEAVLEALSDLKAEGDFPAELEKLASTLHEKIKPQQP